MNVSKVVGLCMVLVVSTLPAMEVPASQTPQGWVIDAAELPTPLDLGLPSSSAQTGGLPRVLSQESLSNTAAQTETAPVAQSSSWFGWPSWLSWGNTATVPTDSIAATPSPTPLAIEPHAVSAAIVQSRSSRPTSLSDDSFPALPVVRQASASSSANLQELKISPEKSWAKRVGSLHTVAGLVGVVRSASLPLPGADSPARIPDDLDPLSCIENQETRKRARRRAAHRNKKKQSLAYQKLVEQE